MIIVAGASGDHPTAMLGPAGTLLELGRIRNPRDLSGRSVIGQERNGVDMTKKLISLLGVVALLLAACGTAEDDTTAAAPSEDAADTDADAAEEEVEEPAEPDEEIELRWRTRPNNQETIDLYQSISDDIAAAAAGVTLVYEPGGTDGSEYQDVLRTELASGTGPDVFWIPGTDVADFAKRGLLYDIRALADTTDGYNDELFYDGPMFHLTYSPDTGQTGDALWGLPRDVSTFAMYLNLDLIEEAGAPDPRELAENDAWDWDSFVEVAAAVDTLGGEIRGLGANSWWANYGWFINAAGGSFFNDDRTACALDSDEAIAGLTFMSTLYQDLDVAIPFGEASETPFYSGNVGMMLNGRWVTPAARASAEFDWDVVRLPDGPAGQGNWQFWGAYVMNGATEHPEQAWELMLELTAEDVQRRTSEAGGSIPSRVSDEAIADFLTFNPPDNNQAYLDGLADNATAEGPLWEGNWPEFDAIMAPAVQQLITGQTTPDQFQAEICRELDMAFD